MEIDKLALQNNFSIQMMNVIQNWVFLLS